MEENDEDSPLQPPNQTRKTNAKWTFWLVYSTAVCIGGSSFQFGYNTSCINAPETVIKDFYKKEYGTFTNIEWSIAVGIFAVGGMFGAIIGPLLANKYGRRKSLFFNNVLAYVAVLFMFLSYKTKYPQLLLVGRFVIGINAGINTSVAPMYLSEIAPIPLRGAIGTMNQFGIVVGILVGFIFGLQEVLGNKSGWPWLMCFSIVPATLQLLTLPCCPASPRYLLLRLNQEAAAVYSLQVLRGTTDVSEDIAEMRTEQETAILEQDVPLIKILTRSDLHMPLLVAIVLQFSQQLSGINAVFYYSTSTFEKAHVAGSQYGTVGVGVVSIIMTAITVVLVDKFGRRPLMLVGLGGMIVLYAVMTIAFRYESYRAMGYLAIAATLILVCFFQLGPGPIPWFITAELFTQGPRPKACAIAATANWFANFLVGVGFPTLQEKLYPYTFVVFIVLNVGFWLFVFFLVPETKGRSVEEISQQFKSRGNRHYTYSPIGSQEYATN